MAVKLMCRNQSTVISYPARVCHSPAAGGGGGGTFSPAAAAEITFYGELGECSNSPAILLNLDLSVAFEP
jgi:hypothetical protein